MTKANKKLAAEFEQSAKEERMRTQAPEMYRALEQARARIISYRLEECGKWGIHYHDWIKKDFPEGDPFLKEINAVIAAVEER